MSKISTMDEMAKQLAENALDNFLYDGKPLREWMKIIASEDCVSREKVIAIVEKVFMLPLETEEDIENAFEYLKREIKDLPPVQPNEQPKTGHWIPTYGNVKCSVCGSVKDSRNIGKATHYCDFCGAKMEVEE